jgi:DNA-binding response OmpR family regulator
VNVVTATSAPECVVRVAAQRPEVVLADLALGMSLARMLASVAPQCQLIVTTPVQLARSPEVAAFAAAGAQVLVKPFEREELLLLLEAALISRTKASR